MAKNVLEKFWWAFVVRGIIAILFAIIALFWTKYALELLVLFFGIFVLLDGLISVFGSFSAKSHHDEWWVYFIRGLIGIIVGVVTFLWPGITALVLAYLIAIWAVILGIVELWIGSKMLKEVGGKWILNTAGVISVIIGLVIIFFPYSSLITVTWLIGIFALISGIGMIVFGIQVKK